MITDTQLDAFCKAVDEIIVANLGATSYRHEPETALDYASRVHGFKPCKFERGPKYTRIVRDCNSKSVFCFVDNETGAIYKAAGWKSPEPKKHVRGNIANGAADVTPYGARYR